MEKTESILKIALALLAAQREMGNALKETKNTFFKSSYADLNSVREAVIPSLNKHGISVLQPTVYLDGKPFVQTILLHESGEYISSFTEIICDKINNAQSHGSGVTYARRYGLQSICCIGSEDDDGNAASGNIGEKPKAESNGKVETEKKWLNLWADKDHKDFTKEGMATMKKLSSGEVTMETVKKFYKLSKETEAYLIENCQNPMPNEQPN